MAAKIHIKARCFFYPDRPTVAFVVDPALFHVNEKVPFSFPCFYPEMDKFLTDTVKHDFSIGYWLHYFNDVLLACRFKKSNVDR